MSSKTLISASGKRVTTSPWAFAKKAGAHDLMQIEYPNLHGLKAMIVIPDDFYRKKLAALGPGYIATAMRRCGMEVGIIDCSAWSYDDIELAKIIIQSKSKIFGIGAMYPMFKEVERICGIIRAVVPGATIILGGALPTPIPEFALRKTTADYCTIGEAEITIVGLMSALAGERRVEDVPGIAYIRDNQYFHNGNPTLSRKVAKAEVGWPALDLYPIERYIAAPKFHPFNQSDRLLPINTGRGCPYACNFCFRVSAYRIRPYDEIVEEMEYLMDRYKLDGFYIVDDLLMLSERKVTDFCEAVLNRGLKIKFNCSGRVNTVTPHIARLLKEAGCVAIYYGVESGNQEILTEMSKKTTLEEIYQAVSLTREQGIYCQYGLMFGQPGENEQTLRDSIDLIKKISYGEYRAQKIFGCVPFPGSGLYDWCKETGRIKDDQDFYDRYIRQDWSLDQIPINMTNLPDGQVHKLFKGANDELSQFYLEKMAQDWVSFFGGDKRPLEHGEMSSMNHLFNRVEATEATFDVSGRT